MKQNYFKAISQLAPSLTMCYLRAGEDLADLLPNPEEILREPQLSELAGNDVFQFLLKAVYEHVNSLMEATR